MSELDPFTYELLRHRLWTINAEGAIALQRVSGSPLATEAFDMNTSIMSAGGEVVFVGPYLLTGPMGQGMIVRSILADPGRYGVIEPGDVFLCNDPYVGSAHQNCVTLVGPIHHDGHLVAWAGATLHVVDVGGPTAGQVGIGARSIHDEAPPTPPVRIVRAGHVEAEVEAGWLERARTPELNALDLRAKLAAVGTIRERVGSLAAGHGREVIERVLDESIERATSHFRARLGELPDGTVHKSAFVDRSEDGGIEHYEIALRLEKQGDRLVLDFRDSSPQAPAVINCTRSGLMSGVLVGVLTTLVWDAAWCPAAVERSIEVQTTPGTVVDARWPAGCSMATMASGFASTTTTALALGELLARTSTLGARAMAAWAGAVGSVDVFGVDGSGRRFGTVLLDTMASGTGATAAADGIDTGGFLRSVAAVVANVEHTEAQFPVLYLYRRQEPDTGGPGRHRGGAGVGYAIVPHGVERLDTVSPHFSGTIEPESLGLVGGYPGATNLAAVAVGSSVPDGLSRGIVPSTLPEIGGDVRVQPGVAAVALEANDALIVRATGGGGFGDPVEREPAAVAADVRAGLVSSEAASSAYGVVLADAVSVDLAATSQRRAAMRRERLGTDAAAASDGPDGWLSRAAAGSTIVVCRGCGHEEPASDPDDPLSRFPFALRPLAGDRNLADVGSPEFRLRERYCPSCARLLAVDRIRPGGARE
jgi:N-methylhydantoinase B